jgi:hypothetical protein
LSSLGGQQVLSLVDGKHKVRFFSLVNLMIPMLACMLKFDANITKDQLPVIIRLSLAVRTSRSTNALTGTVCPLSKKKNGVCRRAAAEAKIRLSHTLDPSSECRCRGAGAAVLDRFAPAFLHTYVDARTTGSRSVPLC